MSLEFDNLRNIIRELREKCPWEREQTLQSLASNITEEAAEAREAIERNDIKNLKEELGDTILVALMLSQIAEEQGLFKVEDSLNAASEKMKRRHPHVFGDAKAETADEALKLFYEAKAKEKKE